MGPVEQAIRGQLGSNRRFLTPARRKPFLLSEINSDGIVLLLAMRHRTPVDWDCLEGTITFLRGKRWVLCAGVHSVHSVPDSFDEYMKENGPPRDVTNWVAVILESAGVAELDRRTPLMIRLAPEYR